MVATRRHTPFTMLCILLAGLGLGCGSSSGNDKGDASSGGSSSATGGDASSGGSSSATGGDASSGGSSAATGGEGSGGALTGGANETGGILEQTPPPEMPRELGPPDGIYCESTFDDPPLETCSVGSRCCPNDGTLNIEQVCMEDAAKCRPCDGLTCAQLLCDGPEDCSTGEFCCYAELGSCKYSPDDCTPATAGDGMWPFKTVECRSRCVSNDPRDPDHGIVVCKDDRDCPGPYVEGSCKPLNIGELPRGLSVCSGP